MGVFILFWAVSGIVLNHRETFSGIDIGREILAKEYQYENWNNAAIKGKIELESDSMLVFGNIGIWLTTDNFNTYQDFNNGFPDGIDHRKTFCMLRSASNNLYAGTLFGLYYYNKGSGIWQKILLDIENERIVGLTEDNGNILILSRSFLFRATDHPGNFSPARITLPPPVNYDHQVSLFKTLWVIHSGEIYGHFGKLVVDAFATVLIILLITGIIHFIAPGWLRRRKRKQKRIKPIARLNRFSYRWHKKIGIWAVAFLLLTSTTGMFLRPPLLIAIATARVDKISYTRLADSNPWHDKLRTIIPDPDSGGYMIGTSEGIFYASYDFSNPLLPLPSQPPVSVMGINVLEKLDSDTYLVGSFNGLFAWKPNKGIFIDYLTGETPQFNERGGSPIGKDMVSGYLVDKSGNEYFFDYNRGAVPINHERRFIEMPGRIITDSPMSLWNLALEIHTARFFKFLFGRFYILFIPLFGLTMITILITGLVVWIILYNRKSKANENCTK